MKKAILILITAALLCAAVTSACAEYKKYRLPTEAHPADYIWFFYPYDAHDVIVSTYLTTDRTWQLRLYRDGEPVRCLEGTVEKRQERELCVPKPASWNETVIYLSYAIRQGELVFTEDSVAGTVPDPVRYRTHIAEWTDTGLQNDLEQTEGWKAFCSGTVAVCERDGVLTIRCDGRETAADVQDLKVNRVMECFRIAEDDYLLKIYNERICEAEAVRVQNGREVYRTTLPRSEVIEGRPFMPDRNGGFFIMEGYSPGGYDALYLNHYDAQGREDRKTALWGDNVVVDVFQTDIRPEKGICTLYGSAVANSRKVYTIFAMNLDENMNVLSLDVRNIDRDYRDYEPSVHMAPDGSVWVFIQEIQTGKGLDAVLIPFNEMKKSKKTHGLKLQWVGNE